MFFFSDILGPCLGGLHLYIHIRFDNDWHTCIYNTDVSEFICHMEFSILENITFWNLDLFPKCCFVVLGIPDMDKGLKPSNSESYTPSSDHFRFY
jgi:hypothetical protein